MSMCETCANYVYDEYEDYYFCQAHMDEDEVGRFLRGSEKNCPYYRNDDDYKLVKKQN